jgi:teichoic acid transport system permease protein
MSLAEYAKQHGLKKVGAREPFFEYLRHAWQRRDFAYIMALYANQAANAKNRLGRWWIVLLPTIQAGVYGLIFGVLLGSSRPDNFIPYLFTGVFLYSFLQGVFSAGANAVTGNLGLVRSLSFPRILLPANAVIQQVFALLPQLGLLLVTLVLFRQSITWNWFALIPIVILMVMFGFGLATISARLTVHVADLNKLIPFITRIVFYISGIFFNMQKVLHAYPVALAIANQNPVYVYISLARGAVVNGYSMSADLWIAAIAWAFGTMLVGLWFFWRAEERYGREI